MNGRVDIQEGPDPEKLKELEARPYQLELLEKAKKENIIVYLGTGSGKTFIAVLLIKHMRGELGVLEDEIINGGKKAIFLVTSVALVEQQAKQIKYSTGLQVGSYCGADGVDDWEESKWRREFQKYQVFVFIHDVFKQVLSAKFFRFSDICLLILDECHHAVKSHAYSLIMDQYAQDKENGHTVPKILGLTACVVVKTCTIDKFRTEKSKLERKLDSLVQTTEDLYEIQKYVTAPAESFQFFSPQFGRHSEELTAIGNLIGGTIDEIMSIKDNEVDRIKREIRSINTRHVAFADITKEFKKLKNDVLEDFLYIVTSVGLYCGMSRIPHLVSDIRKEIDKPVNVYYDHDVRRRLFEKTLDTLVKIQTICNQLWNSYGDKELEKIHIFSSPKLIKLMDVLELERQEKDETGRHFCATSHFETTCQDVLDIFKRGTGEEFDTSKVKHTLEDEI